MIIVTGAAGFIGSNLVKALNNNGINDILAIDHEHQFTLTRYLDNTQCLKIPFDDKRYLDYNVSAVLHMGAISDTTEKDWNKFNTYNVISTMHWRDFANSRKIPFIWASSSAIYGNGSGPLNAYAITKLLSEQQCVGQGVALRFHNVYGPNEAHKGRMASVIFNWFNQAKNTGNIKLFENSDKFNRDLILVDDVCNIILHMLKNYKPGIYDVGTGISVNMESIAKMVISRMNIDDQSIVKIPMPNDLIAQYQVKTKAYIKPLKQLGFDTTSILDLKTGINEYINHLELSARK